MAIRSGLGTRFSRWVWHANHDDKVPTVVAGVVPVVALLAYLVSNAPAWFIVVLLVSSVVGVALAWGWSHVRTAHGSTDRESAVDPVDAHRA